MGDWPTDHLPHALRALDLEPTSDPADRAAAKQLILNYGKSHFTQQASEEYIYRRSNRQIFIAMLPTIPIMVFDVGLTVALLLPTRCHELGSILSGVAAVVLTPMLFMAIRSATRYQEQVAQRLTIDTAFFDRWRG